MVHLVSRLCAAALACLALTSPSLAQGAVPEHKDRLFAYPQVIAQSDGGAHVTYAYDKMRDINGRDEVPERRVRSRYVSLGVRARQQDLVQGGIRHFATGKTDGARFIVVYLHGQGGSRKQGVDDFTFGGNFNRLKNLAVAGGGLYLTPDFPDFGTGGAKAVSSLLRYYSEKSPKAPILLACGSMGGALCWQLASDGEVAGRLGGLILLGSLWSDDFLKSAGFKARVPVMIAHGSRDKVFPVDRQESFFRSIRAADPSYPLRFARFEGGTHGTPIRMIDWRDTLNWMLATAR